MIPVLMRDRKYSLIFGQTKNKEASRCSCLDASATSKLLPSSVLPDGHPMRNLYPFLTIYHQVGRTDGEVVMENCHLSITGLKSPSPEVVSAKVSSLLFDICNTRVDALSSQWKTSEGRNASLLHNVLPLSYSKVPATGTGIEAPVAETLPSSRGDTASLSSSSSSSSSSSHVPYSALFPLSGAPPIHDHFTRSAKRQLTESSSATSSQPARKT